MQDKLLKYYNVTKPVTLSVDFIIYGLGACLMQDSKPVSYASRSLNQAEKNYAQIEKELLAIVFRCKKYHLLPRCEKGIFVGYDKNSPAYLVYHPDCGKIMKHRLIKFIKNTSIEQCTQTEVEDIGLGRKVESEIYSNDLRHRRKSPLNLNPEPI